jgi:hypothetical protein
MNTGKKEKYDNRIEGLNDTLYQSHDAILTFDFKLLTFDF